MVADFGESRFLLNPWEENMTKQPGEKSINICNLIIIQTGICILLPKLFYPTVRKTFELKAEGREFAKILRSIEQFVRTVKGQNNFW